MTNDGAAAVERFDSSPDRPALENDSTPTPLDGEGVGLSIRTQATDYTNLPLKILQIFFAGLFPTCQLINQSGAM